MQMGGLRLRRRRQSQGRPAQSRAGRRVPGAARPASTGYTRPIRYTLKWRPRRKQMDSTYANRSARFRRLSGAGCQWERAPANRREPSQLASGVNSSACVCVDLPLELEAKD